MLRAAPLPVLTAGAELLRRMLEAEGDEAEGREELRGALAQEFCSLVGLFCELTNGRGSVAASPLVRFAAATLLSLLLTLLAQTTVAPLEQEDMQRLWRNVWEFLSRPDSLATLGDSLTLCFTSLSKWIVAAGDQELSVLVDTMLTEQAHLKIFSGLVGEAISSGSSDHTKAGDRLLVLLAEASPQCRSSLKSHITRAGAAAEGALPSAVACCRGFKAQ